ncbi:MAG: haloacid dehalogenase [Acetobacteraceae bacterium]|nr:haloacid dehalogenase [Acetobacteraceae bacterium]
MLDLTRFQALTFDCYGTLIDWEGGIAAAIAPALAAEGLRHAPEAVLEAFGRFEHAHEAGDPAPLYPEVLRRTMLDVQNALGMRHDARQAETFAASVPDWPAFPDSAAALAVLRRHYRRLVILSNVHKAGIAASRKRLSGPGGDPFDFAITAEETGCYKPALKHFERARERFAAEGIAPKNWLHVAQSLYHDHGPAKQLGLASVWIDRRMGKAGAGATPQAAAGYDLHFPSMAAFAEAVERAFAGKA